VISKSSARKIEEDNREVKDIMSDRGEYCVVKNLQITLVSDLFLRNGMMEQSRLL